LIVLDLEQLEQLDLLARRSDHAQMSAVIGEEDARSCDAQQIDAAALSWVRTSMTSKSPTSVWAMSTKVVTVKA